MKRSLFFCTLSFLIGIYLSGFYPDVIFVAPLLGLACFLLILSAFGKCRPVYAALLLFFLLGAITYSVKSNPVHNPLSPYMNEYVTVTAEVTSDLSQSETSGSISFTARVRELSFLRNEIELCENVRFFLPKGEPVPTFGKRFRALCLLEEPDDAENSGGFDYALYLKSKDISCVARIEKGTYEDLGEFPLSFSEKLLKLNRRCGVGIDAIFKYGAQDAAAFVKALSMGNTLTMTEDMKEALSRSGLSHATSVSGMHVTILISAIYMLLSLMRQNRHRKIYIVVIVLIVLLFTLFTGSSPAVVRSAIMGILMTSAYLFRRRADGLTSLGAAAVVICLLNPFAAFDVGFILSFGATLGILLFTRPMEKPLLKLFHLPETKGNFWQQTARGVVTLLCATTSAQLLVVPISASVFGYVSLWSFVTNLLASPSMSVLLIGGLALGFLSLLHPYLMIPVAIFVYPFAKLFSWIVSFFGNLENGLLAVPSFGVFAYYLFALGIYGFYQLLKKRYQRTAVSLIACFLLLFLSLAHNAANPLAIVSFINVGQGDCTLMELPDGTTLLIDGGGAISYDEETSPYDVGREVVLPYLNRLGIGRLDYMIASHPHADHIDGLDNLLEEIPVGTLLVPVGFDKEELGRKLIAKAQERGTQVLNLEAGDCYDFSDLCRMEVHMPTAVWLNGLKDVNDSSMVFSLFYGENQMLFMGDLTESGEKYLLQTMPETDADILKVGHHGSAYSSSKAFLLWAKPDYAFIPCGENNYGHPALPTLSRLREQETITYRADWDKDVRFYLNEETIISIQTGGEKP